MADTIKVEKGSADDSKGQPIQLTLRATKIEVKTETAEVKPQTGGLPGPNIPRWMAEAEPGSPADRERQRRETEWRQRQAIQPAAPPPPPAAPPPPAPTPPPAPRQTQLAAPPPPTPGGPNIPDWMRGAEPGSPADRERQRRQAEWQARQPQPPPAPAGPPPPQPPPQQMTATRLGQQFAEQERRRQEAEALEKARQVEVSGAGKMPAAEAGAGEAAAGGAAEAGAAAGPIGVAVAGIVIAGAMVKDAFEKAIPQVGKFGEAVVQMDAEKVARGFGDLAGKIPLFGTAVQNATHAILDVSNAANQEGRRLAMYSGQLAATYAGIDVRNIQRDIERAQRNADLYASHAAAREDFNERIYEILQALEPHVLTGLTTLVDIGTAAVEAAKMGFNGVIEAIAYLLENLARQDWANELRNNWRVTLNLQREAARRRAETVNPFLDQLLAMRRPQAAIDAERERQQQLRRDQRGPTFQGFDNL